MARSEFVLLLVVAAVAVGGCATHYTTPAGGVPMAELADEDLQAFYAREPASPSPPRKRLLNEKRSQAGRA